MAGQLAGTPDGGTGARRDGDARAFERGTVVLRLRWAQGVIRRRRRLDHVAELVECGVEATGR
jgi:hypothetical protein